MSVGKVHDIESALRCTRPSNVRQVLKVEWDTSHFKFGVNDLFMISPENYDENLRLRQAAQRRRAVHASGPEPRRSSTRRRTELEAGFPGETCNCVDICLSWRKTIRPSGEPTRPTCEPIWSNPLKKHPMKMHLMRNLPYDRRSLRLALARLTSALVIIATSVCPLAADEPEEDKPLTVERIFDSREFRSESLGPLRWLKDQAAYAVLERSEKDDKDEKDSDEEKKNENKDDGKNDDKDDDASDRSGRLGIVRYDAKSGDRKVLVPLRLLIPSGESLPLSIDSYSFSDDKSKLLIFTNSKRVWRQRTRGDYWVLDISGRELRKLGGDAAPSTMMFAKFSPDGRHVAYVREKNIYVEHLSDRRITQLTDDGSDIIINGTFDWVYEEELGLRDGIRWSPDSRRVAYWQLNTKGVREIYLINHTDSVYPRLKPIKYPKVGERNSASRVGVVNARGGKTLWLDVPGDPRNHYIARMDWAENTKEIEIQQLNRLQNTNLVMLADAGSGKLRTILTERDDAWVDIYGNLRWIDDGKRFLWLSDRDGWRHVYVVSRSGEEVRLVTPGDFDVTSISAVDEAGGWLYYMASPDNPSQRYLYRVRLDGSDLQRVTPADQSGTHSYRFSDDAHWAIHSYSTFDTPPVTQLVRLPEHKTVRVLADNSELREELSKIKRQPTEFFYTDIGQDVSLHGWLMKPSDFDPEKKYPLLIYVYGEPAGQTVTDSWSARNYLWYLMHTQHGYLVMSIDNRGTASARGREFRKSIYRQIGILSSKDQAAALRTVLDSREYVDRDRIGIWGWSGGGSMSLNMIFRYPELYHTAMSVAAVPNQRHYDTIYQERYMGLPRDNVKGFREGSPITYAHQLKGNLLIVHGTADDNVHYQGFEALVNELIAENKRFTMMAYPNRTHSIREGAGTTRHLYELLTRYLYENLPEGSRDR